MGKNLFASMWNTLNRILEGPMYFGAFTLSSAHLEFPGLIVMAWKTLKGRWNKGTYLWPLREHIKERSIHNKW